MGFSNLQTMKDYNERIGIHEKFDFSQYVQFLSAVDNKEFYSDTIVVPDKNVVGSNETSAERQAKNRLEEHEVNAWKECLAANVSKFNFSSKLVSRAF